MESSPHWDLQLIWEPLLMCVCGAPGHWYRAAWSKLSLAVLPCLQVENIVAAEYELEHLLLEGHCFDVSSGQPPRGLQFTLGTESEPVIVDTIVMANLVIASKHGPLYNTALICYTLMLFYLINNIFFTFLDINILSAWNCKSPLFCSAGLLSAQSQPRRLDPEAKERALWWNLQDLQVIMCRIGYILSHISEMSATPLCSWFYKLIWKSLF